MKVPPRHSQSRPAGSAANRTGGGRDSRSSPAADAANRGSALSASVRHPFAAADWVRHNGPATHRDRPVVVSLRSAHPCRSWLCSYCACACARSAACDWSRLFAPRADSSVVDDDRTAGSDTNRSRSSLPHVAHTGSLPLSTSGSSYLMWMDALPSSIEGSSVVVPFDSYTAYRRGLALEASGDRAGAARMFAFFIETVDRPPESVKPQLADARARLERLTGDSPRR